MVICIRRPNKADLYEGAEDGLLHQSVEGRENLLPYGPVRTLHDNCQVLAPRTDMPAVTVPMGVTAGDLPAGLQLLGRPFDEGRLIELAYAYEQGTKHRRPPEKFAR